MSGDPYGEVLSAAPPVLAEAAIRRVHELLEAGADTADIHEVVTTSVALLNMHQQNRPGRKRAWLAKVTSFAFPRTFATAWGDTGEHHVCFTASITKGGKQAVGREIEVQLPVADAERLAQQMLRMVEFQRGQTAKASPASPLPERRRAPCSSVTFRLLPHQPHDWEPQPGMEPVHCPGYLAA